MSLFEKLTETYYLLLKIGKISHARNISFVIFALINVPEPGYYLL